MTGLSTRPLDPGLKGLISSGPAIGVLVGCFHLTSLGALVGVGLLAALVVVTTVFSGAIIAMTARHVVLAFVPFWFVRVGNQDVSTILVETIRPFDDFAGWGIKGSSRGKGLVFCAGGTEVVVVVTCDGRRYLVSVRDGDGARVAKHLERHLSIEHS